MDTILIYENDLFSLEVSGRIDGRFGEYIKRIGVSSQKSDEAFVDYSFSTVPRQFALWSEEEKKCLQILEVKNRVHTRPVFFETRYFFRADFKDGYSARVIHPLASVSDSFNFSRGTLVGTLDFINTPGKFILNFDIYKKGERVRMETIEFMVVSEKMDVVRDYNHILSDIQKEQRDLIFRFMSKTSLGAKLVSKSSRGDDDVWYMIFQSVFQYYLNACEQVVNQPHLKYIKKVYGKKADAIKKWNPKLVNRYVAMDNDRRENEIFRVEQFEPTVDTQENRFVLNTLRELSKRLKVFAKTLQSAREGVSYDYIKMICAQGEKLDRLSSHSFFRRVGRFVGFRQESLVLQKRPGYAQIYSAWITLTKGLDPVGNDIDIGHRPMSALYEFWCFITMRKMLETHFGKPKNNGAIDWSKFIDYGDENDGRLVKVDEVFLDLINNRTIILSYQKSYNDSTSNETYASLNSQRPDIVLSIKENNGEKSVFTYLFDAKYRIEDKKGCDCSPREAIDDMHRYRDAILYRSQKDGLSAHEVIGAYVLYPGRPLPNSFDYMPVIRNENIGAIALLPGERGEGKLNDFIGEILSKKTIDKHLEKSIPPRGAVVQIDSAEAVKMSTVFGTSRGKEHLKWMKENGVYNLPEGVAVKQGIDSNDIANQKKWLVIVPAQREKDKETRVMRIVGFEGIISSDDLIAKYGKYKKDKLTHQKYFVWRINYT